jgi:integrase
LEPPQNPARFSLVFRKSDGRRWGSIRTAFVKACRRAGIKDFRFHDLRHTAASHMLMLGARLIEVQEVLGHKNDRMTRRYAHLDPSFKRRTVERLEALSTKSAQAEVNYEKDVVSVDTPR